VDGITLVLILGGGILAGIINTVAGGGSIITLPLLIFSGLPPSVANGTNRVAIVLQTATALAGFRRHRYTVGRGTWLLLIPSLLGGFGGARLATTLEEETLRRVIGGVLILMLVPLFRKTRGGMGAGAVTPPLKAWVWPVYFLIGAYGGFLQVGVGFLYLSLLVGAHAMDLIRANLIKTFLVLGYTILTLVVFGRAGQIALVPGLVLAAGMAWGGWIGAKLTVEKGERWIRVLLVAAVLLASAQLLGLLG
jgi:hypothetical protein